MKSSYLKAKSVIIDFSTIIQSSSAITKANTFEEFSFDIVTYLKNISTNLSRMDIVCDTYFKDSLEAQTRNSRGCDQLLEFSPDTLLPKRMQEDFLRNDENKKNLNIFLAHTVLGADFGNTFVIVSLNDDILTNTTADKEKVVNMKKLMLK